MSAIETQRISANGIDFSCLVAGDGPLAICMHGFPDTADTWSHLLPELADAGYRAVAPCMRGYPASSRPSDADYSPITLGKDVVALIDALDAERAVFIGHDWGASAVYTAAALAPDRVEALITLAIPHPLLIRPSLGLLWGIRHFIGFQRLKATTRKAARDPRAFLREIYERWSPTWDVPDSELDVMSEAWSDPAAIEAALAYYVSFRKVIMNARRRAELDKLNAVKVVAPALTILGRDDGALQANNLGNPKKVFGGPHELAWVDGAGHFLHREKPTEVNAKILEFLAQHTSSA